MGDPLDWFRELKKTFEDDGLVSGWTLSLVSVTIIAVYLFFNIYLNKHFSTSFRISGLVILLVAWFVFWALKCFRLPRNKKTRTGIVIALYGRSREALKLKQKFIDELEKNIHTASLGDVFHINVLNNYQAKKIKTKVDLAKVNRKIGGHIFFYGDIQKEHDGDVDKYFINLDGYIVHWPVPIPISQELSVDFRNVLPKEINFSELFGYRCIRMTSKIAYLATKYIVGVASFISANPFLAFRLHKDLEKEFDEYATIEADMLGKGEITRLDAKYLKKLREKLLLILSNEAMVIARIFQANGKIAECIEYVAIAEQKNPNNYAAWLLKAMLAFSVENNPLKALTFINKAKKLARGTHEWRYSKAFLLFWNDKFPDAYKECQKIAKAVYRNENVTVNEVESFNLDILKNRKDKPQLYFWIGYLILKKRVDLVLARKYFQSFIGAGSNMAFLEEKARAFITLIDRS